MSCTPLKGCLWKLGLYIGEIKKHSEEIKLYGRLSLKVGSSDFASYFSLITIIGLYCS